MEENFVYAFVDYRREEAITVETVDKEHYKITLKLFAWLEDGPDASVDTNKLLEEWCAQWTVDDVAKEFAYTYKIREHSWVSPGVFQMVMKSPTQFGNFDTVEKMKDLFLRDCLEDTFYGGYGNFWVIPRSQKRIREE